MTDNEIIKALELCGNRQTGCAGSPYFGDHKQRNRDVLDLINRQKAEIESLNNEIDKLLKQIPTVDAVEVVRCKDCKYYQTDTLYCRTNNNGYCINDEIIKPKNHYCGYGVRKGDNND